MQPTKRNIERIFNVIDQSLFRITRKLDYDRLTDAIMVLSTAVHDYDGDTLDIWYIGEYGDCCLDDLIIGAYWHYTEYHAGQSSKSYAALCCLGQIFNPGMSSIEPDNFAYQQLNIMAQ